MNYRVITQNLYGEQHIVYVKQLDNGSNICFEKESGEYQEYLKWLEEGNTPLPADNLPPE